MSNDSSSSRLSLTNTFAVLRYRDFSVLWVILITSGIGSWLRILGTAQWLLDATESAWLVGVIGLVQLVVQTPALLFGGTFADQLDRKWIMTLSHSVTALVLVALAALHVVDLLTPGWVFAGIAFTAMSHVFASPARSALVPVVVPQHLLLPAASIDTASMNAGAIIGPLVFAAVATTFGLDAVLALGGGLFVLAAVLPFFLKTPGRVEPDETSHAETDQSALQKTGEGIRYVAKHPILPGLFLLDIGITVVSFYRDILPVLALGLFAGGAAVSGTLGAANSVGAVVGSFIAMLFVAYRAKGMLVLYASFAYGVFLFAFGMAPSLWFGVLMIALLGAADAVTVAVRNTTVMLTTPDHMRGRAFSLMYLAAYTANNLGTLWVGFWAGVIGATQSMLLGAVLAVVATAVIGFVWKPIRTFRSDEAG